MENRMIVYKNTKNVILENVEIKRIMSEGGYCGKSYIIGKSLD